MKKLYALIATLLLIQACGAAPSSSKLLKETDPMKPVYSCNLRSFNGDHVEFKEVFTLESDKSSAQTQYGNSVSATISRVTNVDENGEYPAVAVAVRLSGGAMASTDYPVSFGKARVTLEVESRVHYLSCRIVN